MADERLEEAFGSWDGLGIGGDWRERALRLQEYVARTDRTPVESYAEVRTAIQRSWELPVVETSHEVGAMGPLGDADPDYGRCGVRLFGLLGETTIYLVVRSDPRRDERIMLWALLHELGHFVRHQEMLLSLGALYNRVCLAPSLESRVGEFAHRAGTSLHARQEIEADLFALDWLLPPWLDDDDELRDRAEIPGSLTADGYRHYRLRCVLAGTFALSGEMIDRLNRAGAAERERAGGAYPRAGSLWSRASWCLCNRPAARNADPEVKALLREYYRIAGYPPRYAPEMRAGADPAGPVDGATAWLPRAAPDDLEREVDRHRWAPLLVPPASGQHPPFHIPIRPVPSRDPRDSRLAWVNMSTSSIAKPRPLREWLQRAGSQGAGLLAFPRNPAEKVLDSAGWGRS